MQSMKHLFTDRILSEITPQAGWETMPIPFSAAVISPICPAEKPMAVRKTDRKLAAAKQPL